MNRALGSMMPHWARAAITILIAVLLALATLFFLPDAGGEMKIEELSLKYEDRFIHLDKEALDEAYKKHIGKLFEIWVTDYSPKGEPPRAVKGAKNARAAYEQAMNAIEQREQARPK